jgi:hypothetical protein
MVALGPAKWAIRAFSVMCSISPSVPVDLPFR